MSLTTSSSEFVEYAGTIVVIIGVVGEYIVDFTKIIKGKARKAYWGKISTLILIIGLAIELVGLVTTSHAFNLEIATAKSDSDDAKKLASRSDEKRVELEKQVEELKSNNFALSIELEKLRHPSIITTDERKEFIEILCGDHSSSKTRIEVITGNVNRETEKFAFQVRKILDEAGYGDAPSKYQLPVIQMADNSLYSISELPNIDLPPFEWIDAKVAKIPNLNIPALQVITNSSDATIPLAITTTNNLNVILASENPITDNEPDVIALFSGKIPPYGTWGSVMVEYPTKFNPNRGCSYVYFPTKDPNAILYGICEVFHSLGITVGQNTTAGIMLPGHVAFFIPSR